VRALAGVRRRSAQVYNGTNPLELDRITTYFEEIEPRAGLPARYVPRSTQVDLEGGVLKSVSLVA
jgi:tubulin beta